MHMTLTTGWWTCTDCGIDAELPAPSTAGFAVACPDCDSPMTEQWQWDGPGRPAVVPRAA